MIVMSSTALFFCLMPFFTFADEGTAQDKPKDFAGYSLISLIPNTEENIDLLRYLDANINEDGMDFLSHPTSADKRIEILIHPELAKTSKDLFQECNMTISVISSNFIEMIEEEKLELAKKEENFARNLRSRSAQRQGEYPFDLFTYNTLQKMNDYLFHLSQYTANYNPMPGLNVVPYRIGTTYEGRSINMLKISLNDGKKKAAIWMDCGVHSRERISPAFCMYAIDQIIRQPEELLYMFDFYIVPILNPDGYAYMESRNRMWRKNRNPNNGRRSTYQSEGQFGQLEHFLEVIKSFPGSSSQQQIGGEFRGAPATQHGRDGFLRSLSGSRQEGSTYQSGTRNKCIGTDVNRNFDMDWATANPPIGSSDDICRNTFHGNSPFSEEESKATKNAIFWIKSKQKIASFVSVHSHGQYWMTPYASKKSLSPYNSDLERVAGKAVSALSSLYGTQYEYGPIWKLIRMQVGGSSVDWAHEKVTKLFIIYST